VDVDYLTEHEVAVPDEESAIFAIENAISEVCADIDSEEESMRPLTRSFKGRRRVRLEAFRD
jgi:hypothetical protein